MESNPTSPIVFLHGLAGFRRILGREYFSSIPAHLKSRGYEAAFPILHPSETVEFRSSQLQDFLDQHYPDRRVHIIAHSMGGLDARYLASPNGRNQGHRLISITTIATPHHGSSHARLFLALRLMQILAVLFRTAARWRRLDDEPRTFLDIMGEGKTAGVQQLTREYMGNQFNPNVPDHPDVVYRSYSGKMCGRHGAPPALTFLAQWLLLWIMEGSNDGLVSVPSARWGDWRGVIAADHRDEIGHLRPRKWIAFDRLEFYARLAEELAGLERT